LQIIIDFNIKIRTIPFPMQKFSIMGFLVTKGAENMHSLVFACSKLTKWSSATEGGFTGVYPCLEPGDPLSYWINPPTQRTIGFCHKPLSTSSGHRHHTRLLQPYQKHLFLRPSDLNDPPSHTDPFSGTVATQRPFFRHASRLDI
jgi:hypothetical protein